MKSGTTLILALFLLCVSQVKSQNQTNPFYKTETPEFSRYYLGFTTGINNIGGLIGVKADIAASQNLLIGLGAGLGSWGYKYGADLHFYPKGISGVFFKGGFMYATGLEDFETEMELSNGSDKQIMMDLKPVSNIFFTIGHSWNTGQSNRLYLEGGYAVALTNDYYEVKNGDILSDDSEAVMGILRPGGIIIAFGFEFGY